MIDAAVQRDASVDLLDQKNSMKLRKQRGIKPTIGLFVIIAALVMSVLGSHRWKETLKVQRVFVEGGRIVPAVEVVRISKITSGTPLYGVDLARIRANILEQLYVKSAKVVRELPNALRIHVEERQPIAAISQERLLFLDEEGVLLPSYHPNLVRTGFDVPLITGLTGVEQTTLGSVQTDARILQTIGLLKQARALDAELYHLISEVYVDRDNNSILYTSEVGATILFGKNHELKKLTHLQEFWKKFVHQQSADQLSVVDLRFEDQVIVRWKEGNQVRHGGGGQVRSTAISRGYRL